MISFIWACRICLGPLFLHDKPCRPCASTIEPQRQLCGWHVLLPRRKPTATSRVGLVRPLSSRKDNYAVGTYCYLDGTHCDSNVFIIIIVIVIIIIIIISITIIITFMYCPPYADISKCDNVNPNVAELYMHLRGCDWSKRDNVILMLPLTN